MKKIFILCSMAAAMFSCSKFTQEHDGQTVELGGREEVTVSFAFDGLDDFATKATVKESDQNTLEVFAFYDNKLVAHMPQTSNLATAKLTVVAGKLVFCALVNQPSLGTAGITTVESLRAKSQTFAENSPYLPMYGEKVETVSSTMKTVEISLTREVSKILVEKITASLSELYAAFPVQLDAIYILNANVAYHLQGLPASPTYIWKNTAVGSLNKTDYYQAISGTGTALVSSSTSPSYSPNRAFYLCPNASATKTQLGLDFTFLGKKYQLAHTFNSLAQNTIYDIKEVVLKGTGTEIEVSMVLSVNDWENATVGNEGVVVLGQLN